MSLGTVNHPSSALVKLFTRIDCEHEPIPFDMVVEVLPGNSRPHTNVKVLWMVVLYAAQLGQIETHASLDGRNPVLHPSAGAMRY